MWTSNLDVQRLELVQYVSGGYEKYPRRWKDSSKAPVLTFVIFCEDAAEK